MRLREFLDTSGKDGDDDSDEMHSKIGQKVRFNIPTDPVKKKEFLRRRGTISKELHVITGVEKDFVNRPVFRVKTAGWEDHAKSSTPWRADSGRLAQPSELKFVQK